MVSLKNTIATRICLNRGNELNLKTSSHYILNGGQPCPDLWPACFREESFIQISCQCKSSDEPVTHQHDANGAHEACLYLRAHEVGGARRLSVCQIHWTKTVTYLRTMSCCFFNIFGDWSHSVWIAQHFDISDQ